MRKLDVATPAPVLVDAYLAEIAKGYGVDWSPPKPEWSDDPPSDGPDGGVKGGQAPRLVLYVTIR